MTADASPWMLVADVIAYAKSNRTEVMAALADGSLWGRQIRANGKWRTHRDAVDAWLAGQPFTPPVPGRRAS